MTFGLTPLGFKAMRLADVKQALEDAFIAQFGDINLDPQSVFGQEIGVLSKDLADLWENLNEVYFSQYPNSAQGVSLDNVVQLNGIVRLAAQQTLVVATLAGEEGTFIPINSIAKIASTGDAFFANVGGFITKNNADIVKVEVGTVTTQPYTIVLNNAPYTYSLPIITFSNSGAIFSSGDVITVTINGIALAPVNFTTDSNTTLGLIAATITAFDSSTACVATPTNPNIISIVPNSGFNITVGQIDITGSSPASYAITFAAPANQNAITSSLTAIINVGTPTWLAVDNADGTLTINALNPSIPFACSVGVNLSVIYQASPITFLAEDYGPIPAPIGTLTTIVTPISGWDTITNLVAGVTGRFIETDAELRIRRQNSIRLFGAATVEAIRAHLLQDVPGVTSALVFENRTLTQDDIVIVFPGPFVSGDTITVTYNTINTFTVAFNTNQATTMTDLVNKFELLPQVASAVYGGTGNQTVTVSMNIFQDLTVNSASTDVSVLTASITGGRPPKSFEAVVQGGSDANIAETIWLTKPAGIQTYGNTNFTITDSQGDSQVIFFSRATEKFIWVEVVLTLNSQETFPVDGLQLVAQAILNYGNSLGVGVDVLFQRVLSQIFTVPGIASGNLQIAATALATDTPTYGTSDLTILETEISVFDLSRIFVTLV